MEKKRQDQRRNMMAGIREAFIDGVDESDEAAFKKRKKKPQ